MNHRMVLVTGQGAGEPTKTVVLFCFVDLDYSNSTHARSSCAASDAHLVFHWLVPMHLEREGLPLPLFLDPGLPPGLNLAVPRTRALSGPHSRRVRFCLQQDKKLDSALAVSLKAEMIEVLEAAKSGAEPVAPKAPEAPQHRKNQRN